MLVNVGTFIGEPSGAKFSAYGVSLTALALAWSTAASDNTPGFAVSGASLDLAPVGAQIELQVASDINFTPPPTDTELSAVTGNPTTIDVSPALSDAQYWVRCRLLDSGDAPLTDWSNVVTETIETVSAEVTQFLNRATGMDATHVNAFTALIDGLVADGVWSLLDALWIPATDTEAHAKMNLKSSSYSIAETGTVPWTADVGYDITTGTTNYLLSGFNPSTAGGVYVQNSAHVGFWRTSVSAAGIEAIGARDTVAGREVDIYDNAGGTAFFRINNASFSGISTAVANGNGHYVVSRTASNVIAGYKNGSSIVTGTTVSSALINLDLALGGHNANGVVTAKIGTYSAFHIGAGLDATKELALYNRIATYRTAVGL